MLHFFNKRAYLCRGGCFPISLESSSRNAGKSWKAVMKNDWADYSSLLLLCTFHLSKLHLLIPLLRRYLGTETSVNNKVWGETWGISLQCTQPAINSLFVVLYFRPKIWRIIKCNLGLFWRYNLFFLLKPKKARTQCLKITKNVAFDFFNVGIFHQYLSNYKWHFW